MSALLQERTKTHCLQGELWEQHCNRSFSGGLLEKQGRWFRSFLQAAFSSDVYNKLSAKEAVHNLSSSNEFDLNYTLIL